MRVGRIRQVCADVRGSRSHVIHGAIKMSAVISNTTAPPDSEHPRPKTLSDPRVPALVILMNNEQPHRVGEVAFLVGDRYWGLGRLEVEEFAERSSSRVRFGRQRPNEFFLTGPLLGKQLSRRQLSFVVNSSGVEVTRVGRAPLCINGLPASEARLADGDVLTIGNFMVLLFTSRAPAMPRRATDKSTMRPFGDPDGLGIIGESPAAWRLREELVFAARSNAHVLIHGASGSGKELAARAIHALSSRAGGTFVPRNAATIPAGLVDAELFGNAKNYPNAGMAEREGLVGHAEGGTLFLDEIAEMPEEMQAHLLRLMDADGEYSRLGESRTRRADLRIVGATNRPLSALKHDVLARLTVQVELPSLNDRREDIPFLVRHLLRRRLAENPDLAQRFAQAQSDGSSGLQMDPTLIVTLVRHDYKTNVRELDALLWKSMLASTDDRLAVPSELRRELAAQARSNDVDDLLDGIYGGGGLTESDPPLPPDDGMPMVEHTEAEVRAALILNEWKKIPTARTLGITRYQLYRLIVKYGLKPE